MAQPDKKSIPPAGGQKLHLIKSSTWNKIRKLLEMAHLLPDPTQFEVIERAGVKHFRLRTPSSTTTPPPSGKGIPFAQRTLIKEESGSYTITLYPGWIREVVTIGSEGTDACIYHLPESGAVPLDTEPPPDIALALEDFLYINYQTDNQGNITGTPEVIVSSAEESSTHYQPADPDGSGGTDGDYYVRLGQLKDLGDAGVKWIPRVNSEILHIQELWTGENLGTGGKVFKKRDSDTNKEQFRTILTRYGLRHDETEDELQLDLDAENIGGGCEILKLPEVTGDDPLPDEPAKLRTLRELGSSDPDFDTAAQIKVAYADTAPGSGLQENILIRGNSKNFNLIFQTDDESPVEIDRVNFEDGLATEGGDVTVTIPGSGGANLNLLINHFIENGTSGVCSLSYTSFLYWRNGLLVGSVNPADSPTDLIEETVCDVQPTEE